MPVRIVARCHPALEPLLPKPVPAGAALPDWLREMPSEAESPALGGARVRTLKHCPPLIDALGLGLLMPLAADLEITAEGISWDWSPPVIPDQLLSRAPVGVHVPEQASGAPLRLEGRAAIKFMNFWTLSVPEGWSLLFTHPLNREDLPFRSLSGVVDCDAFADGYVHFAAIWSDPGFRGRLPAGTPVVQAIPVPRGAAELETGTLDEAGAAASRAVQEALQAGPGVYRKRFRQRRG
ncbi:hypothetical protein LNKW23_28330 [Paralimibaculum aggregatum]|uniref:Uncharacterized protein n=1 Tax=Paralimibaculum aggregatum TaxID=3036245 RepID=A0ABQ6LRE0_9RHOB|nr:hypothetical protein [Limibaculum sp. NKW23]GMG83620.1 hypothetical protein LNKW23_28330 [Limibaculum sp. NKW23]